MNIKVKKPYGNIYFEKELPNDCGGCPFNYDTIRCEALWYSERPKELEEGLDGKLKTRYKKCPLKSCKELQHELSESV